MALLLDCNCKEDDNICCWKYCKEPFCFRSVHEDRICKNKCHVRMCKNIRFIYNIYCEYCFMTYCYKCGGDHCYSRCNYNLCRYRNCYKICNYISVYSGSLIDQLFSKYGNTEIPTDISTCILSFVPLYNLYFIRRKSSWNWSTSRIYRRKL